MKWTTNDKIIGKHLHILTIKVKLIMITFVVFDELQNLSLHIDRCHAVDMIMEAKS